MTYKRQQIQSLEKRINERRKFIQVLHENKQKTFF